MIPEEKAQESRRRAPGLKITIPEGEDRDHSDKVPQKPFLALADTLGQLNAEVHVRHTFIHLPEPVEFDEFHRERAVVSCPAIKVGRLQHVFNDFVSSSAPETNGIAAPGLRRTPKPVLRLVDALLETMPTTPESFSFGAAAYQQPNYMLSSSESQGGFYGSQHVVHDVRSDGCFQQAQWPSNQFAEAKPQLGPAQLHPDANVWCNNGLYGHSTAAQLGLVQAPVASSVATFRAVTAPAPLEPAPGSAELPSMGSIGHGRGICKPCAFLHTKGCENGAVCRFCHLCEPGEKKRRQKEKRHALKGGA